MSKYKIEVEIDVDFEKFFKNIPEDLYEGENTGCDKIYELTSIHNVLQTMYTNILSHGIDQMVRPEYKYIEHHILIDREIGRQITENCKITEI